ncbi:unnamed protein product, partial [Rotaria sp. Silwood2]
MIASANFYSHMICTQDIDEYSSMNSNYPLPYLMLHRFCLQILPKIHDKIKWLNLESLSMKRILLPTNYSNLYELGLYDLEIERVKNLII